VLLESAAVRAYYRGALAGLRHVELGSQQGGGHSLLAVARRELDCVLDKRSQTSDWSRRPLTPSQPAMDVEVLVDLYLATQGRAQ
jgi:ribonuclease D